MTATLITPTPHGTTEAVNVDGVTVYRAGRSGWRIQQADLLAIWERVSAEHPTQDGEKALSTTFPALNITLMTTKAQRAAYIKETERLVRAARRATQPRRDAKRAAKREAQQHYYDMIVKTAFLGGAQ